MALMASSLLNGERVIVLLLITRILFSTPFSLLLFEAVALSLLAATALIAEIYVECSSPCKFSTRPGASSGILLGAVTLPAVMFSKMVQLSRGLLLEEVALAEIAILGYIYICCFSVLLFLDLVIRHSSSSKLLLNFNFMSFILCALVYLMVPANGSTSGLHFTTIFWMVGHGVAAVKLIQHILYTFPSCASIGGLGTSAGDN